MKINLTGIQDNLQHVAGLIVGLTVLKFTGKRYNKSDRGTKWFSTVAANLAANGDDVKIFPYVVFID